MVMKYRKALLTDLKGAQGHRNDSQSSFRFTNKRFGSKMELMQ
jgi:hypothetical protein